MRTILWMLLAMLSACGDDESCKPVQYSVLHMVQLSAQTAGGEATETLRPGDQLVIEGAAQFCASYCASFDLDCVVMPEPSGRLRLEITGERCSTGAEACPASCQQPPVRCVTPPLMAGEYVLTGYPEYESTIQDYPFTVTEAGSAFDPAPF